MPGGGGGLSPGWDGHEAGQRSSPRNELRLRPYEIVGIFQSLLFLAVFWSPRGYEEDRAGVDLFGWKPRGRARSGGGKEELRENNACASTGGSAVYICEFEQRRSKKSKVVSVCCRVRMGAGH